MKGWKVGLTFLVLIQVYGTKGSDPICGFPGTPASGYVKPDEAAYYEGDIVSYSCRVGYILLGSHIRKCTKNGSWTDEVPICDDSMTNLGFASSTPAVLGHSAELALDRDRNTCTYLKQRKPRWWRIDLGAKYKVLSVAVTVPSPDKYMKFTVNVIAINGTDGLYHRCASFSGKFGTPTVVLTCAKGEGIEGRKVHIEDHQLNERLFELCEVEVQVEKKDTGYACGRPSRSIYSITFDSSGDSVDYGCIRGYEIVGSDYRTCVNTGQWSGEPPICRPIICNRLIAPESGLVEVMQGNRSTPLEGATVAYRCDEGFRLVGSITRECLRDGSWSGNDPQCKAIRCPIPDGKLQRGIYRLVNKTNSMGSMAMLRCKRGKREGDNPYITCTEDGSWTKPEAHCILPAGASYEVKEEPRIVNQGAVIFGMVVAAVMIVVVMVALYLYTQKRRNEKPEIPSRFQEPPAPPPRPPPRTKSNVFKSAIMGFMSRDTAAKDDDIELKNWKTHSLPSDHSFSNDMGDPNSPKKLRSFGGSLRQEDKPAVIEVEVLSHHGSGNKGKFRSVPEENENTSLENVELNVDEKESNKGSEREPQSGAEYAAVDYEKKRQSRLLKEQDSMESSSTAAASPIPADEIDKHVSPSPPKSLSPSESEEESEEVSSEEKEDEEQKKKEEEDRKAKEEEERKAKEEEERKAKEEEERKAKEEEERKAKEEEERKAKEEEEKKAKEEAEKKAKEAEKETDAAARRRRLRNEPPPPVEDKPVLRRFRR